MPTYYYNDIDVAFVRVPKTGSSSIMRGFFPKKTLQEYRFFGPIPDSLTPEKSFAFVRHPTERFASAMAMFRAREFGPSLNLEQALGILENGGIEISKNSPESLFKLHIIPMTHEHFGLKRVAKIFYYEDYSREWMRLADYLNIEPPRMMLLGPSSTGLRPSFSKAEHAKIKQIYHDDFKHFGYE